jgi:hypothetical protein
MHYFSNILQQNSFNPSSDNPEMLTVQCLRSVATRTEVLLTVAFGVCIDCYFIVGYLDVMLLAQTFSSVRMLFELS